MPRTEQDPLGPGFEWRLRHALNRVQPRFSTPRYASGPAPSVRSWRLAPAALALGLVGVLSMSAYAATGSPNPAVWTRQAVTVIQSAGHAPATVPGTEATPPPVKASPHAGVGTAPTHTPEQESTPRPEPSDSPRPSSRPEPSDSPDPRDRSGSGWGWGGETQGSGRGGTGSGD